MSIKKLEFSTYILRLTFEEIQKLIKILFDIIRISPETLNLRSLFLHLLSKRTNLPQYPMLMLILIS